MTRLFNIYPKFYFSALTLFSKLYLVYRSTVKSLRPEQHYNAAIYSTQNRTCELSLYFQTTDSQNLCHRRLLLHHKTPFLQNYESTWIHHLPERQHVVLRCWNDKAWTSSTHILCGNGVIYITSHCQLTTDKFQTLPDIIGNTQATIDQRKLYAPDQVAIVTNHELQTLEEAIPSEIAQLDEGRSRVALPRRIIDMNSLLSTSRITTIILAPCHTYNPLFDNSPSIHCVFLKVPHTQDDRTLHDSTKYLQSEHHRTKPCSRNFCTNSEENAPDAKGTKDMYFPFVQTSLHSD